MGSEHRQFPRKSLQVEIHASHAQGLGHLIFESLDLSGGGVFLKCDLLLEVGDRLALEFQLSSGTVFESKAIVAWVRRFPKSNEAAGMGVAFHDMSATQRQILTDFLGSAT
jgi:Tfp pilus assembly protein PilZ